MGDSGEGLIDAQARIQERMEELQRERELAKRPVTQNPEQARQLESLKLARTQMEQQIQATTSAARKSQLAAALAEIERRIADLQ